MQNFEIRPLQRGGGMLLLVQNSTTPSCFVAKEENEKKWLEDWRQLIDTCVYSTIFQRLSNLDKQVRLKKGEQAIHTSRSRLG